MKRLVVIMVLGASSLSGCALLHKAGDLERGEQSSGVDNISAYPIMTRKSFEKLQLFLLLDPEGKAQASYDEELRKKQHVQQWSDLDPPEKYELAFKAFYKYDGSDSAKLKLLRNRVQDRILSASVQRCNVFKNYLQRDQADTNFLLGSAATVSGVLGALIPGVQAAKNLAGAAGLFSGVRAEYNQSYYANLAAFVIVKGIEERQKEVLERIQRMGQNTTIENYTVEAAVKDAVYFDGLCGVVAGLEQASDAIRLYSDPGIDTVNRVLLKTRRTRLLLNDASTDVADLKKYEYTESEMRPSLAGTLLTGVQSSSIQENDLDVLQYLADTRARIERAVKATANTLAGLPKDDKLQRMTTFDTQVLAKLSENQKPAMDALEACRSGPVLSAATNIASARVKLKGAASEPDRIVAKAGMETALLEGRRVVSDLDAVIGKELWGLKEIEKKAGNDTAVVAPYDEKTSLDALGKFLKSIEDVNSASAVGSCKSAV